MKYLITIAISMLTFSFLQAQEKTEKITLKECIDFAIENNLDLKNQTLTQTVLQNNYQQAKNERLPEISASSLFSTNYGQTFDYKESDFINQRATNFNIGAMSYVDLFDGFRKYYTINRRLLEAQSGDYQYDVIRNQIVLNVVNAYLQILYNQEQTETITLQLEATILQIERTEKLLNSGTVTRGDLLSLLSQKAEEESQLIDYKNRVKMSKLGLIQLMNYPENQIEITKPEINESDITTFSPEKIETLYSEALAFLPELKLSENLLQISNQDLKLAKSGYLPSLRLNAGFSTNYNNQFTNPLDTINSYGFSNQLKDNKQIEFGLSLSIPIFNKFRNRTNVQNATIAILQAENEILKSKQDIYKTIQSAYNDVSTAQENYKAQQQSVTAYKESYRFAEQRFNAGIINATDYNLEKTKLNTALSKLLQSKYDLLVKLKILDFYRGQEVKM